LATARVPRRSLREPSPPYLLFRSTTTVLFSGTEAESADLLCQVLQFSERKLLGDGRHPPNQGSLARSLLNWIPPSCPNLRSLCARTLIRVPRCGALNILSVFIRALHFGSTSNGVICGLPSRNPIIGKAEITPERSPGFPGGAVWADSPIAIHPIGTALTPKDWGFF